MSLRLKDRMCVATGAARGVGLSIAERFGEERGRLERLTRFHPAFAMFRGAVGSAGVAVRGDLGNGVLPDAARGVAVIEEQT